MTNELELLLLHPSSYASAFARLRFAVALGHRVPVHGVPPGVDVVGPLVLVFEVICVLPDVHADDGNLALHVRAVLVGRANDLELAVRKHQPGPAAAEAGNAGLLEL